MDSSFIARGVTPVEAPDPLQVAQQAQTLQMGRQAIQQGALKLQASQEDQEDQDTGKALFLKHGGDYEKVLPEARSQMRLRNVQTLEAEHLKNQQAFAAKTRDQLVNQKLLTDAASRDVDAIMTAPDELKPQMWKKTIADYTAKGVDVSSLPPDLPDDPVLRKQLLETLGAKVGATKAYLNNALQKEKAARERALTSRADEQAASVAGVEDRRNKADMREEARRTHELVETPEQHKAWWNALPKQIQGDYPSELVTAKRTAAQTHDMITRSAMNADQLSKADEKKQAREDLNARAADVLAERTQNHADSLDLRRELGESRRRGDEQTANSRAVDRRKAQGEIDKIKVEESHLNRLRDQLGTAITKGNIYVDKQGNVKSLQAASGGDQEVASSLLEEMKGRFKGASDDLKRAVADKNTLHEAYIGAPGSVSTEQAHKAIDEGTEKLFNPQANGATPAASAKKQMPQPGIPAVIPPQNRPGVPAVIPSATQLAAPAPGVNPASAPAPAPAVVPPAIPQVGVPAAPTPASARPAAQPHAVGAVKYGPDGKMYRILGYDKNGRAIVEEASRR